MRRLLLFLSILFVLLPTRAAAQANNFSAGQMVIVTTAETLRSGPDITANAVATVTPGDEFQVLADDPTESDGAFWWSVHLVDQDLSGWLPDTTLAPKYHSPATDPAARGAGPCAGFEAYATDYQSAFTVVALTHPDAQAILDNAVLTQMDSAAFAASLSREDMALLGVYYTAAAEAIGALTPPTFAQAWQDLQQQSLAVTGQIFTDASSFGLVAAGGMHAQDSPPIIAGLNAFFAEPNRCPAFLTWAYAMTAYRTLIDTPE